MLNEEPDIWSLTLNASRVTCLLTIEMERPEGSKDSGVERTGPKWKI